MKRGVNDMFNISLILFYMVSIILFAYTIICLRRNTEISTSMGRAFFFASIMTSAYGITIFSNNYLVMSICHTLVFISIDWMLYFLNMFIYQYTRYEAERSWNTIFALILVIDSIILAINPFYNIALDYEVIYYGTQVFLKYVPKILYDVHLTLCYLLVLNCIHILLKRIGRTAACYRIKYYYVIGVIVAIIIANGIFLFIPNQIIDYSILLYVLAAFAFNYFINEFTPTKLIGDLHRIVVDSSHDAILIYDDNGELLTLNESARNLFDEDKIFNIKSSPMADDDINEEKVYEKIINNRYYEINLQRIFDNNKRLSALVFILHDITEAKELLIHEHMSAIFDGLTNIYSRRGFFEGCEEFDLKGKDYSLVVMGINNFKAINSLYGIHIGDKVLIDIANRLRSVNFEQDIIYGRTAEAKFAILVETSKLSVLFELLNSISIEIEGDIQIIVNSYFGYISVDDPSKSYEYYYERALRALAEAKYSAVHPHVHYDEAAENRINFEQKLYLSMNRALIDKEFYIVLQPQVDIETHKVIGAEALARWHHAKLGEISPGIFIPLFEQNGFVKKLDVFLWREACRNVVEFQKQFGEDFYVAINVSQKDIIDEDVPTIFANLVDEYKIKPSSLHIEITESACMENRDILINTLDKLKELGFVVEIDDFGSGYSSLNILTELSYDIVKLDMKFMENYQLERNNIVLSAITEMIGKLGASIIVEGIESEAQEECVKEIGCRYVQGYYYAKPLTVDEFVEYTKSCNDM